MWYYGKYHYSDLSCTMVVVPCEPISIKDKLEFVETILRIIKMVLEFGQSDIVKSISDWIIDFISNLWAKKNIHLSSWAESNQEAYI